ncbi:MAG: hypothetical protein P8Y45_21235, partial [Exilibacterium sp.]
MTCSIARTGAVGAESRSLAPFIASFNRENLFLAVQPKTDGLAQTLAFLKSHPDESGRDGQH